MPYRTYWEENGICWEFFGSVSAEEIQAANEEFYRDYRSKKAGYQLIITLETDDVEWRELDIVEVSAKDIGASRAIPDLKVAFVADNDEIWSKIEKYVDLSATMNSTWKFMGFETVEEARNWLSLP